ncbi:MAG: hypothetical protein ACI8UO_001175 [Verrucomicrobiales bacterium]|jgi:hypothetical protein
MDKLRDAWLLEVGGGGGRGTKYLLKLTPNQVGIDYEYSRRRSRGSYGSPRMTPELRERGIYFSENRIARLMRAEGILARRKRAFRPKTTIQDGEATSRIAPNRLAELDRVDSPGQVLVGDITYVATREGWLYLAVVMDLFSRSILGWKISESLSTPWHPRRFSKRCATRRYQAQACFTPIASANTPANNTPEYWS